MPIYEYRCSSCSHELEALQKFTDAPLRACPACQGETLVKLMSASGFQLKGSGWYATDFKGGGAKPAAKSGDHEGKADGNSESKSDGKPDSKTDAKSDSKSDGKSEGKSDGKSESKTDGKSEGKTETRPAAKTAGAPPTTTS